MIATCEICGQIIRGREVPLMIIGSDVEEHRAMKAGSELQDFDLLAAAVANHLMNFHPQHAAEMAAIQFLAAKVYAMTWAHDHTINENTFNKLRDSWKTGIMHGLFPQAYADAASEDSSASSSPAPAPPVGS